MEKSATPLPKKAKKRSASYPAFSLQEVVTSTKNLKDRLGDGPYSRDSMAVALGYKGVTGSSSMKIASCVHFGLLDRNGNTYNQSELANRIFNYITDEERANSLMEAFSRPALYQKLITEYSGKSLPLMLESILIRSHGIQENAAKSAVSTFKESAEYVGALKNGVLSVSQDQATDATTQEEVSVNQPSVNQPSVDSHYQAQKQSYAQTSAVPAGLLSVNLPSGLVVSYSQSLASAFAFGAFGSELRALDDAVASHVHKNTVLESTAQQEEREV